MPIDLDYLAPMEEKSKRQRFAETIRAMKPGEDFDVALDYDRSLILNIAKVLSNSGVIKTRIVTRVRKAGGFRVMCIKP